MTGFIDEIFEQPEALRRCVAAFDPQPLQAWRDGLRNGNLRRVIFSGMGSSIHAATAAALHLQEAGFDALTVEASELLYYSGALLNEHTLLVPISQSGRSVEVVKLLDVAGGRCPILGITNTADSPLAQAGQATILIQAGAERTVSTKTYTNTLAALHLLVLALLGESVSAGQGAITRLATAIGEYLPAWKAQSEALVAALPEPRSLFFLGRGPSRASALTGALICKESTRLPAEGMVSGQFRHGPMEVIEPGVLPVMFGGPEQTRTLNVKLAEALAGLSGGLVYIGAGAADGLPAGSVFALPEVGDPLLPIAEAVPTQLVVAALAARRGLYIDGFRYGQKVTVTE